MHGALEIVIILGATVAMVVTSSGIVVSLVRRANRVSPRHRHRVPLTWMWSPTPSAHLHRRLRNAVMSLRTAVPVPSRRDLPTRLQELAADVEALAASTDQSLVLGRRAPWRDRPTQLGVAFGATQRVESLAGRLCVIAAELDPRVTSRRQWDRDADTLDAALRTFESAIQDLPTDDTAWADDLLDIDRSTSTNGRT